MIKRILIGLAVVAGLLVGGFFAIGGREGLILLYVRMQKPDIAPNRPVEWAKGPDQAAEPAAARKPNVIVIVADDLGFNDVSFYGGGVAGGLVKTPNIDSIGRDGVDFPRGYAGNATCAPSRAAMMTGRYATRFGYEFTPAPVNFSRVIAGHFGDGPHKPIYHEDREKDVPPLAELGLPPSEITIAKLLKAAGYRTLHLGKWHLGETPEMQPNAHGFDESLGFLPGAAMFLPEDHPDAVNSKQDFDPIDRFLWAALAWGVRWNGSELFEPKGYMTDYLTDEAIAAIRANRNRPFFMYLAYNAPHTPLQATRADYDALSAIPDHTLRVYGAMVANLDRNVGRVLAELKAQGLDENTLVIFTSDNGGAHYVGLPDLNRPYRGWKATFFEGGIRVPFFLKWPARVPAGSTFANAVSHFDVFATAAGAAGVAPPSDRPIDGVDLTPFLTGANPGARTTRCSSAPVPTASSRRATGSSRSPRRRRWIGSSISPPTRPRRRISPARIRRRSPR